MNKVWELENQSQIEHSGIHYTHTSSILVDGGIIQIRHRVEDSEAGYAEAKALIGQILTAVNSHEYLVEATRQAKTRAEQGKPADIDHLEIALRKAEAKS